VADRSAAVQIEDVTCGATIRSRRARQDDELSSARRNAARAVRPRAQRVEIGGGSIRIHRASCRIGRQALGISEDERARSSGFLLDAFVRPPPPAHRVRLDGLAMLMTVRSSCAT